MSTQTKSKWQARSFAFGAVFLMSLAPIVVKFGLRQSLDPIPLLTLRFCLASIVLWAVFSFVDPSVLKLKRKAITALIPVSIFFGASFVLYYLALTYIDASIAHMLVAISPAIVLGLLALDRRRTGANSWLRMGLVLAGLFLLVGPTGTLNATGVALGLAMTVFYGAFLFFVEKWLADVPSTTITIYVDTIVAILLVAFYVISYRSWQPITTEGWGIIVFTGLFTTALAHFLYVSSVKKIGSGETALINPFETVFTVTWAMIFLGERLSTLQWIGGALILLSAFLVGRQLAAPNRAVAN